MKLYAVSSFVLDFISGWSSSTCCCILEWDHDRFISSFLDNQRKSPTYCFSCIVRHVFLYSCSVVYHIYIQNKVQKWICISLLHSCISSHRCNCICPSLSCEWLSSNINQNIRVCTKRQTWQHHDFYIHNTNKMWLLNNYSGTVNVAFLS